MRLGRLRETKRKVIGHLLGPSFSSSFMVKNSPWNVRSTGSHEVRGEGPTS